MDLHFTHELIGAGLPVLNKHGAIAKQRLIEWLSKRLLGIGYIPIASPHISNQQLFETSGHYPYYKDSMFPPITGADTNLLVKPMNCPYHLLAYADMGIVSYSSLPVKIYEFGQVYRNEDSGALNGLFRVRSFTQDDGHIFCNESQISEVVDECIKLIDVVASVFNLDFELKLSVRSDDKSSYIGAHNTWDIAEKCLSDVLSSSGKKYSTELGGAAFYGPKIDFIATDLKGRQWQLGTIQLDFNLPSRFNISYMDSDGSRKVPVLIHRALLGSIERFLGIVADNQSLPKWAQPFNLGFIILGDCELYANGIISQIKHAYPTIIRKPENLSGAIKELHLKNITHITVIGPKDMAKEQVMFNNVAFQKDQFVIAMNAMFQVL